jgi:hypothetical protein
MQTVLSAHGSRPQTPKCRSPAALSTDSSPFVDAVAHVQARSLQGQAVLSNAPSPAGDFQRRSSSAQGAPSMMAHVQRAGHSTRNGFFCVGSLFSALAPGGARTSRPGVSENAAEVSGEKMQVQRSQSGKEEPPPNIADVMRPPPEGASDRFPDPGGPRHFSLAGANSLSGATDKARVAGGVEPNCAPFAVNVQRTDHVARAVHVDSDVRLQRPWPQRLQDSLRVRCSICHRMNSKPLAKLLKGETRKDCFS